MNKNTLTTDRLVLRGWKDSDAEELYKYAKDPDIGPITGWQVHKSVEESLDVIRNVLAVDETYAICCKGDDRPVGSIGLRMKGNSELIDSDDECDLGFWVGKPFWGQGIMPEAAKELIRHAFEDLGMERIWCGYYDGNTKSKRTQEKIGFRYQRTIEDFEVKLLNERRTLHVNCLTKEQWLAAR